MLSDAVRQARRPDRQREHGIRELGRDFCCNNLLTYESARRGDAALCCPDLQKMGQKGSRIDKIILYRIPIIYKYKK